MAGKNAMLEYMPEINTTLQPRHHCEVLRPVESPDRLHILPPSCLPKMLYKICNVLDEPHGPLHGCCQS